MEFMFQANTAFNQDISGWDTSLVTTMRSMFQGATVFDQDVSGWNVGSLSTMQNMFTSASVFNQDLCAWGSGLDPGATVTDAFLNSNCPNQGDPDFVLNDPPGPFCVTCT